MRKILLTIVMVFSMLFAITTETKAQTPSALSITGGYSWLNGVVGADFQYANIGVSGGWMPTTMPLSGDRISSFGAAFSLYSREYMSSMGSSRWYASIGYASQGYRYQYTSTYSGSSEMTSPMTIVMGGIKNTYNNMFVKLGGGYGWCEYANAFTFELIIGINLFNNN